MYHIKSDKRSQASANELARGLNTCLKTMPLSTVTVSDLHRETGISRATFYRLFDTIEDILVYQCDQMLSRVLDSWSDHEVPNAYEAIRSIILLGFENMDFLEYMVENRRFDLLYEYTARQIFSIDALRRSFTEGLDEIQTEYMISNLAMSMVATLATWIRRGRVETAEDIFDSTVRYWETMSSIIQSKT